MSQSQEKQKDQVLKSLINSIKLDIDSSREGFYVEKAANLLIQFCSLKSEQFETLIDIFHGISDDYHRDHPVSKLRIAFALISVMPENQEIIQFIIDSYNDNESLDHYLHPEKHEYFDQGFECKHDTYMCLIELLKSSQDANLGWVHIFAKIVNDENRLEIIDALVAKVHSIQDLKVKCDFVYVIGLIEKDHEMVAQTLMDILDKGDKKSIKSAIRTVKNLKLDYPEITHKIVALSVSEDEVRNISRYSVKGIVQNNTLAKETQKLIILNADKVHPEVLWHCTKKMDYRDFYVTQLEM